MKIKVHITDNINDIISNVFDMISKAMDTDEEIEFDLKETTSFSPVLCVLLPVLMESTKTKVKFLLPCDVQNMYFPKGLDTRCMRLSNFRAMMQTYRKEDYIPLIKFASSPSAEDYMDEIISIVEDIVIFQIGEVANISTGLRYIIGESIDNIVQHSKSQYGIICAKVNREEMYVDLCIGDNGITLLGSYKENKDEDICSDLEAIMAANQGISTKNLPNAENRGFGIITSKRMLVEGLQGQFFMISGNAMTIVSSSCRQYVELQEDIPCKGTIVIYRIPYNNREFNYIKYIE